MNLMMGEMEIEKFRELLQHCILVSDDSFVSQYRILKEVLEGVCWMSLREDSCSTSSSLTEQLLFLYKEYDIPPLLQKKIHQFRLTLYQILNKEEKEQSKINSFLHRDIDTINQLLDLLSEGESKKVCIQRVSVSDFPVSAKEIKRMRVIYHAKDEDFLYVEPLDFVSVELKKVRYSNKKSPSEFKETCDLLWRGAQLNLLWVTIDSEGILFPEYFVIEPDYLIDISTLAECYRPYGAHPLNYILGKLSPIANAMPILLGNIVNLFLDEWVYSEDKPNYIECMMKAFRLYPLELASCKDLKDAALEREFAQKCKMHFEHIGSLIANELVDGTYKLDRRDAVLEPSYVCEALGLQGRLDYMQRDYSALIEMKSGKADEFTLRKSGRFLPFENHRIQMLLYLAVLQFLSKEHNVTQAYLLYTKYPLLYPSSPSVGAIKRAINLRNQIVACEYHIHKQNDTDYTQRLFQNIIPEKLKTLPVGERFWMQYLLPPIANLNERIQGLSAIEENYFYRLYNFITKELYLSKSGSLDYGRFHGAASLWLSPFVEKVERGDILYDLEIVSNHAAEARKAYVVLKRPLKNGDEKKGIEGLPNFRLGDAIVLYQRNKAADSVTNQRVFKGNVCELTSSIITIRLRASQKNKKILPKDSLYAIEHDTMDVGFRNMFLGLHYFLSGNQDRRDLLLGQRKPEMDSSYGSLIQQVTDDFERLALKALAAKDYFLVVGPPGTGKTSRALRRMVEVFYEDNESQILLMAYTNRAVDEICKTLESIHPSIHYMRIGSELSCNECYRSQLMENQLEVCRNRKQVMQKLTNCSVFVGTVASIAGKKELFDIKKFDVAIIDEASQILEAQLLGILMMCDEQGSNSIDKFILIGDHKQLPAIVLQSEEESEVKESNLRAIGIKNFRNSLFERLYVNSSPRVVDQLCKQGRMHPAIAEFPNLAFYGGRLESLGLSHQIEPIQVPVSGMISPKILQRTTFIPSMVEEEAVYSKVNSSEAQIVKQLLYDLYACHESSFNPNQTVGVITPFRSQIALIKESIAEMGIDCLNEVAVDTVERFQGSERDIIIYSFCVNNLFQLRMLPNLMQENGIWIDRKLNVVLTRARKQLFITGVESILRQNEIYAQLIGFLRKER